MRTATTNLMNILLQVLICGQAAIAGGENPKNQPHGFIENRGQIIDQNGAPQPDVLFINQAPGLKVHLRRNGFSYECYRVDKPENESTSLMKKSNGIMKGTLADPSEKTVHTVDIILDGVSTAGVEIIPEEPAADHLNYYTLGAPEEGIKGVRHYGKVTYRNIYPQIDMEFVINDNSPAATDEKSGIEYNFIIRPGGDPGNIRLRYNGANAVDLVKGKIQISTSAGLVEEHIPYSFQPEYGKMKERSIGVYYVQSGNTFGFAPGLYDKTRTLVIDPTPNLSWATFYGGSGEENNTSSPQHYIASDGSGNVFLASGTQSTNNIASTGAFKTSGGGGGDELSFVVKFNAAGVRQWGTYYGGAGQTWVKSVATDGANNVLVLGSTGLSQISCPGCIATSGAYQTACISCVNYNDEYYIVKFDPAGARVWGTYYGTLGVYGGLHMGYLIESGIATDNANNVIIAGTLEGVGQDAVVAKLNSSGQFQWQSVLSGDSEDFILDVTTVGTDIFVAGVTTGSTDLATAGTYKTVPQGGADGFVAKLNSSGATSWVTYYGGNDYDLPRNITADPSGNLIISGQTMSDTGITSAGAYQAARAGGMDCFVGKLNSSGTSRSWGTYFGGSLDEPECVGGLDTDGSGNVFYGAATSSSNGIATAGAYQTTVGYGLIAKFNSSGSLQWGTYFSEMISGLAVDNSSPDNFAIGGIAYGNLSATTGAHQTAPGGGTDVFVAKFGPSSLPVELLSFTATPVESKWVLTEWSTSTEINNDYYTIERSANGETWEFIGTVKGAGNSTMPLSYSLTDEQPYSGTSYYRLKQVDFNGDFVYYGPVAVRLEGLDIISLYPNPAADHIRYTVISGVDDNEMSFSLTDVLGRNVWTEVQTLLKGRNEYTLNAANLAEGVYTIRLATSSGEYRTQKQFVK